MHTNDTGSSTLSVVEASKVLGVSFGYGYRMIQDGTFPVPTIKVGRSVRVPIHEIEKFLGTEVTPVTVPRSQPVVIEPVDLPDTAPIGDRVVALRQARRMTQRALAARSGLSRSYVCDIERGRADGSSLETMKRLAAALEVPVTELVRSEETGDESSLAEQVDSLILDLSAMLDRLEKIKRSLTD